MAEANGTSWRQLAADKKAIRMIVAQVNVESGFVPDPTATSEKAQEYMISIGIQPEDNIFPAG